MSFATLRKTVCTDIDIGTALKEIAANPHNGDSTAYWTSSQRSGNSSSFCFVNNYGNANSASASSTWLSAPVCFRIRKS